MSEQELLSGKVEKRNKEKRLAQYIRGFGGMRIETEENKKGRTDRVKNIN